jgi:hypothetical protein
MNNTLINIAAASNALAMRTGKPAGAAPTLAQRDTGPLAERPTP